MDGRESGSWLVKAAESISMFLNDSVLHHRHFSGFAASPTAHVPDSSFQINNIYDC